LSIKNGHLSIFAFFDHRSQVSPPTEFNREEDYRL
jgi:hypothetical protein